MESFDGIDLDIEISLTDARKINKTLNVGDTISITSGEETKTYTVILYGDVNGDGKINALDLLKIQKHILKTSPLKVADYMLTAHPYQKIPKLQ